MASLQFWRYGVSAKTGLSGVNVLSLGERACWIGDFSLWPRVTLSVHEMHFAFSCDFDQPANCCSSSTFPSFCAPGFAILGEILAYVTAVKVSFTTQWLRLLGSSWSGTMSLAIVDSGVFVSSVCDHFLILPHSVFVDGACLGVFPLPAFTCLGHERQDLLSPCDGMHVCTD